MLSLSFCFLHFLIRLGALLFLDIREAIWYLNWLCSTGFPLSSCFYDSDKLESYLFFLPPWGSRCSAPFCFRNRVVTSTWKRLIGREINYRRIFRISLTSMLVLVQARRCKYMGYPWWSHNVVATMFLFWNKEMAANLCLYLNVFYIIFKNNVALITLWLIF